MISYAVAAAAAADGADDAGCWRRPRMSCAGHGEVARVSSTTKLITIHHPHRMQSITSLLQCRIQAAAHQICIARDLLRH